MKSNVLKTVVTLVVTFALLSSFSSCKKDDNPVIDPKKPTLRQVGDNEKLVANPSPAEFRCSYEGDINQEEYVLGEETKIVFNRFPNTIGEFKQARQILGITPAGAIALNVMAMEMYKQDPSFGTPCVNLVNVKTGANEILGRLHEIFRQDKDGGYLRPYQAAAFLQGATPQNGYTPQMDDNGNYVIIVKTSPVEGRYSESTIFNTKVIPLIVMSEARKVYQHATIAGHYLPFEVLKTTNADQVSNGRYFLLFSNGNLTFQIESIKGSFSPLKPFSK